MTDPTTVLGITGSVSPDSRTKRVVDTALQALSENDFVETDSLHLANYDLDTPDGRLLDAYTGDTAAALSLIGESDAYIIGTPVYRASYSGALKNLFDLIPRGQWQADIAPLENAAVGLVATGATDHHYLAIDDVLRPILGFFGAHTVGASVYAHQAHFTDGALTDPTIRDRARVLGLATLELSRAIESGQHLAALPPQL